MNVYGVTIKGSHPDYFSKRYYGAAPDIPAAMELCSLKAYSQGWKNVEIEDVCTIGSLGFVHIDLFEEKEKWQP